MTQDNFQSPDLEDKDYFPSLHPEGIFDAMILRAQAHETQPCIRVKLRTEFGVLFTYLHRLARGKWEPILSQYAKESQIEWDFSETSVHVIAKTVSRLTDQHPIQVKVEHKEPRDSFLTASEKAGHVARGMPYAVAHIVRVHTAKTSEPDK